MHIANIYFYTFFLVLLNLQLYQDRFQNFHVEFNMRQANEDAHELARVATSEFSTAFIIKTLIVLMKKFTCLDQRCFKRGLFQQSSP